MLASKQAGRIRDQMRSELVYVRRCVAALALPKILSLERARCGYDPTGASTVRYKYQVLSGFTFSDGRVLL